MPAPSSDRRIVTKCDMCPPRLDGGYLPACVDACPTHAIITVEKVNVDQWRADHRAADAPELSGDLTLSTTRIELPRTCCSRRTRPATGTCVPASLHWPLVWLTLVSQVALGVSATAGGLGERCWRPSSPAPGWSAPSATSGGRSPRKALRNPRRSWLSRRSPCCRRRHLAVAAVLVLGLVPVAAPCGCGRGVRLGACTRGPGSAGVDSPLTVARFFATALALGPR